MKDFRRELNRVKSDLQQTVEKEVDNIEHEIKNLRKDIGGNYWYCIGVDNNIINQHTTTERDKKYEDFYKKVEKETKDRKSGNNNNNKDNDNNNFSFFSISCYWCYSYD